MPSDENRSTGRTAPLSPTSPLYPANAILQRHAEDLAAYFQRILTRYSDAPRRLMEAISYSLLSGGKRLRPALVLETSAACCSALHQSSVRSESIRRSALAAAAAAELIHTFSLVHDDLPAMDDDDLRRGRPTNHKVFGEALAILAGDAMVTMAFEVLAADADPAIAPSLIATLASAAGPDGMIGGQVLDITSENTSLTINDLEKVHRMKTGALLTACCRMGAVAAGARELLNCISDFGRHLGIAFQVIDDLLDVTATPEQLGKATQKDAASGKTTYAALLGIQAGRQIAADHISQAIAAIDQMGDSARPLRDLATFVLERQA